jgi:hypothetical protein
VSRLQPVFCAAISARESVRETSHLHPFSDLVALDLFSIAGQSLSWRFVEVAREVDATTIATRKH